MKKTCIIVLSFGDRDETDYDYLNYSNWHLALAVSQMRTPIIAQWEIAKFLETRLHNPAVKTIEPSNGKYFDSYEVMKKAKEAMQELGFTEAILVGHQDHIPRIVMIAKKLGIRRSKIFFSESKLVYPIPYDPHSTQWWTRSKFNFLFYEFVFARPIMFLKGQI